MTPEPLDELYFQWLYRQVADLRVKNPARTYWTLLRQLHSKEFLWSVPNDDNRLEDGKFLRYEFLEDRPPATAIADNRWLNAGCSMLEMMIALSRRLSFLSGGAASEWFWHLMDNIGIRECSDAVKYNPHMVDRALTRVITRHYDEDGNGGLFPLRKPKVDQRSLELWDQMNCYLIERG